MISQSLILLVLLLSSAQIVELIHADEPILARPGCSYTCGDVIIPFPFGIGSNCSLDPWYEIECRESPNSNGSTSTKPFLSKFNTFEVMGVNIDRDPISYPTMRVGIPLMNACLADGQARQVDLSGSPFRFSRKHNLFIMEGCPGSAVMVNQSKMIMAGCGTVCHNNNTAISTNNCYGVHCCQTPLPSIYFEEFDLPLQFYEIDFNRESSGEPQSCLVASIIESPFVNEYVGKLSSSNPHSRVPVVLHWNWIVVIP